MSNELISLDDILPGDTDRGIIVGMTGCGKTTLANQIIIKAIRRGRSVVVYDAKGLMAVPNIRDDKDIPLFDRVESLEECVRSKAKGIIYAPNHEELDLQNSVMFARLNEFFRWIYERRNTLLYVDEVFSVMQGKKIPHYYHACITRGRAFNISVISGTQIPKEIPSVVLSESEHYFIFKLVMPTHQKRIEEICALRMERIQSLQKREFFYVSVESGDIIGPNRLVLK